MSIRYDLSRLEGLIADAHIRGEDEALEGLSARKSKILERKASLEAELSDLLDQQETIAIRIREIYCELG